MTTSFTVAQQLEGEPGDWPEMAFWEVSPISTNYRKPFFLLDCQANGAPLTP
jgi:hypothetical protein